MEVSRLLTESCDNNIREATGYEGDNINDYLRSIIPKKVCGKSWTTNRLSISCQDCGLVSTSCICMDCYLHGNHKGHRVICKYCAGASCDCGDKSLWKEEGFCSKHQGSRGEIDKTDISPELRQALIDSYQILLSQAIDIAHNGEDPSIIFKWLCDKIEVGDSIRRCFTIVLDDIDIVELIKIVPLITPKCSALLAKTISGVSNDDIFRNSIVFKYNRQIVPILTFLTKTALTAVEKNDKKVLDSLQAFKKCMFYFYSKSIKFDPKEKFEAFIDVMELTIEAALTLPSKKIFNRTPLYYTISNIYSVFQECEDLELTKEYALKFANNLSTIEGMRPITRKFGDKSNDNTKIALMLQNITYMNSFVSMYTYEKGIFIPEVLDIFADWIKANKGSQIQKPRSVCRLGTQISLLNSLHELTSLMLHLSNDSTKYLKDMAERAGMTIDDFCNAVICEPVKIIATTALMYQRLFIRNDTATFIAFVSILFRDSYFNRFLPSFTLVQYCFEAVTDKNRLINTIATIYGVFDDVDEEETAKTRLEFIIFAFNLAIDRTYLNFDKDKIIENLIAASIKGMEPKPYDYISRDIPVDDESELNRYIEKICTPLVQGDKLLFKAKDNIPWNVISPGIKGSEVCELINSFTTKNADTPFQIPLQEGHPELFNILLTPTVLDSFFYAIQSNDIISRQFFNAFLLLASNMGKLDCKVEGEKMSFKSHEDFAHNYSGDISKFIVSTINIGGKSINIRDEFLKTPIGKKVLRKAGFEIPMTESERELQRKKNKERALAAKRAALNSLKNDDALKLLEEEDQLSEDEGQNDVCEVCRENDEDEQLYYQANIVNSCVASLMEKRDINTATLISICSHIVHKRCINVGQFNLYSCPIDRFPKNSFIPIIDTDLKNELVVDMVEGLNAFLSDYRKYNGKITYNTSANNLASMLTLIDLKEPNIAASTNFTLFKLLFRIFYKYEDKFLVEEEEDKNDDIENDTLLGKLIHALLVSDDPEAEFMDTVKKFFADATKETAIPFLRRCYILRMYLFEQHAPEDFEEALEYSKLCEFFGVKEIEAVPLIPEPILKAPEFAIDLFGDSFNEDEHSCNTRTVYCLFDGSIADLQELAKYERKFHGSFVPFVIITGDRALSTILFIPSNSVILNKHPIYTTEMGKIALGWRSHEVIKLNKECYATLENELINGNIFAFND